MGYKVGKGIDQYISHLSNLALESEEITKRGVYDGMKVVADAIVSSIGSIKPGHGISEADIEGLRSGFGIARIENRGGTINTKSGFAGKKEVVEISPKAQARLPFILPPKPCAPIFNLFTSARIFSSNSL